MINQKLLTSIEFDKVLDRVADYAVLTETKAKITALTPATSYEEATFSMRMTEEASRLLYTYGVGQVEFFDAFEDEFDRLRMHGTLSMGSLLRFARLLRSSRVTRSSIFAIEDESVSHIKTLASGLYADSHIEGEITSKILSEETVADNASEKLYSIRARIKRLNVEIREKLQSFIHKDNSKYLQDSLITMRGDRYVIPVKAEYKSSIRGFVHDQSASGSTVFIEPEVVLELNNELKTQALLEEAEIDRILSELSERVGGVAPSLLRNIEILEELDLYYAKATYGYKTKSIPPKLNSHGIVEIKKGRHPLIEAAKVVPLDIRLGRDYHYLLITGPNTGGKTVSLKLVGLFSVMALCGLFVPATEANLAVFHKIFCDVGDEQSIEQSLSTFSSHMTNIISIVKEADENTLVLIDEIGAGTDPEEGSALALALLKDLMDRGTFGIITTHYQALKEFAFQDERIENASMEFNPFTFAPVYKINIGLPGSSNAIEISKRLGLPKYLADKAMENLSEHKVAFEYVLKKAEESRKAADMEREELAALKKKAREDAEAVAKERDKLIAEREKLATGAKIELRRMVGERLYEADDLLEKIKEIYEKEEISGADLIEARTLRNKLENAKFKAEEDNIPRTEYRQATPNDMKVGAEVFVSSMNATGTVTEYNPKKNEATVFVGQMRLTVKIKNLSVPTIKPKKKEEKKTQKISVARGDTTSPKNVVTEINLLGETVDEALMDLDAFIDQAIIGGASELRIIHGIGTGKLKAAVGSYLKKHPQIKEFRPGEYGEGSRGVTIAKLK